MAQRLEFVTLARQPGVSLSALCRRFGISRPTAYKWLERYANEGQDGLADRSRRPHHAPGQTVVDVETAVVAIRDANPAWGGRKIRHRLLALDYPDVPSASTITTILRRNGRMDPPAREPAPAWQRFERPTPNALWQMDFMGHLPLGRGRVHPFSLIDDHSRFSLALVACAAEQQSLAKQLLTTAFRRYGLPDQILSDNGSPWGTSGQRGITALEAWLLQIGVDITHGRAYHPQTQGKVERWHGTIHAEVFRYHAFPDLAACQLGFDRFRDSYNLERPHEALDYTTPASRYQPSPRTFPEVLPDITYGPGDLVCAVNRDGMIYIDQRRYFVSRGLAGYPVAVRPTLDLDQVTVHFCARQVAKLNLKRSWKV